MDEIFQSKLHYQNHEDKLYHELTQPTEDIILERNRKLRNNPEVMRDLGAESGETWGRQIASIPFVIFEKALRDGYDLNSKDSSIANIEMARFLASDIGKTCLVR